MGVDIKMSWKTVLLLVSISLIGAHSHGSKSQNFKSLDGQHLRIAYVEVEGMIVGKTDPSNGNITTHHGLLADMWKMLAKFMKFKYTFIKVPEDAYQEQGPTMILMNLLVKGSRCSCHTSTTRPIYIFCGGFHHGGHNGNAFSRPTNAEDGEPCFCRSQPVRNQSSFFSFSTLFSPINKCFFFISFSRSG